LVLLVATVSARRHHRVARQDAGGVNPVGAVLNQFESLRTQLSSITDVLAQLNQQFSTAVQTGIRSVAGLQAEGDQSTTAAPGIPSGIPDQSNLPSTPAPPSSPGVPSGQPSVPSQSQNQTQGLPGGEQQSQAQNITSNPGQGQGVPNGGDQTGQVQNATQGGGAGSVPGAPSTPTAPGVPGTNGTGIGGVDLGGSVLRSIQDILAQFGSVGRTLNEISGQFNQLVQTSSRLVTGRRKRQANPLEAITGLLGTLSRQVNDLTSQVTGLLGGLGGAGATRGQGQGQGQGGSPLDSILGALSRVTGGLGGAAGR